MTRGQRQAAAVMTGKKATPPRRELPAKVPVNPKPLPKPLPLAVLPASLNPHSALNSEPHTRTSQTSILNQTLHPKT